MIKNVVASVMLSGAVVVICLSNRYTQRQVDDGFSARRSQMEHIQNTIDQRASDRWTKSDHKEFEKRLDERLSHLEATTRRS